MLLFNQSLKQGIIPQCWKESRIVAIPKVSSPSSPNHFRPISLPCILSKVLERHVWNLIEDFLEETGAISDRQWGFRAGRSTVSALLSTTSDWFLVFPT